MDNSDVCNNSGKSITSKEMKEILKRYNQNYAEDKARKYGFDLMSSTTNTSIKGSEDNEELDSHIPPVEFFEIFKKKNKQNFYRNKLMQRVQIEGLRKLSLSFN